MVDALCWHGAEESLVERGSRREHWPQMLVRALVYRMVTDQEASRASGEPWHPHAAYAPVAALVIAAAEAED